ncbi:phospholipase A [Pelobium sp.]|nr:phospholipase A [Pelobium sp.]MDA9554970.1 phospholipase A [Pelobium sp.]
MTKKLTRFYKVSGITLLSLTLLTSSFLKAQNQEDKSDLGFKNQSSSMSERWELGKKYHKGLFLVTPYKPVYVTAGRWSSNPNEQPMSENPDYSLPFKINYNHYEAKFQFSFKTKVARDLFWGTANLWAAYSQKAHWQIYNAPLSRPFRELNYEPEVILNFTTNYKFLGFDGKMLGIVFNHQSNGRALPLSRSWNRVILQAGFERKNWQVTLRPWLRLKDAEDENPLISDYTGRGEAIVVYNKNKHQFSAVMSHSLKFKDGGKGNIQLNWTYPLVQNLHLHFQLFDGYGETLQDYNHKQTTLGLGLTLVDW